MRPPATAIAGQLVFARNATVWAVWRLPTVTHVLTPVDDKLRRHGAVKAALGSLTDPAMLLSVCRDLTIDEVAAAASSTPGTVTAQLAAIQRTDAAVWQRRTYLAVQLADTATGWERAVAAATGMLGRLAGTNPSVPDPDEVAVARRKASEIAAKLAGLGPVPARPGELAWLYARAPLRAIATVPLPDEEDGRGPAVEVPRVDATFFEGGHGDDVDRPTHRRYLRVDTVQGRAYQTVQVLADLPPTWTFPDGVGEWFAAVDAAPWPVDWAAWILPISNDRARTTTLREARALTDQVAQYEGEPSGPPPTLAAAADAVEAQRQELVANPSACELQTTMALSVAAPTLAQLEDRAGQLAGLLEGYEYLVPRPVGHQLDLTAAMLPGATGPPGTLGLPAACRDYRQFLMPRDLAASAPLTSGAVGDPSGMLLGVNADAPGTPVFVDAARGPATRRSGSMGIFGALGAGKSYVLKRIAHATVAAGGVVVVLDRTESGEYAALAEVMPGRSQVVSLAADTDTCLDPLAIFTDPDDRVRFAVGFLSQLCQTAPTSPAGITLATATATVAARPDARLIDVVEQLADRDDADAAELARTLDYLASEPMARVAFGRRRPLALDADYLVVRTPGLSLPDRDQLAAGGDGQLLPEQLISQALLYLVAAAARQITFRTNRFAAALFDEAWALTASAAGRALLLEGIRDGRKHNAAVWLASQHPTDIGDDRLADLLGVRMVFRLAGSAAPAGLALLGLDDTPAARDLVTTDAPDALAPGRCLLADLDGRVARVTVAATCNDTLEAAFDTNPTPVAVP